MSEMMQSCPVSWHIKLHQETELHVDIAFGKLAEELTVILADVTVVIENRV